MNNKNHLPIAKQLHRALCAGVLIFLGLCLTIFKKEPTVENDIINQVAAGFAVFAVIMSIVYPKILLKAKNPAHNYQVIKLVQWAILEGAIIFNLVSHFRNGIFYSVIVAAVLIAILISRYPNETEMNELFPFKAESPKFEDDRF